MTAANTSRKPALFTAIGHRWRIVAAAAGGVAASLVAGVEFNAPSAAPLFGWVVGAAIYVITTAWMFYTTDEAAVRRHAAQEDENRGILTAGILAAAAASLGVAMFALRHAKGLVSGDAQASQMIVVCLASSTLILSWLMAQCLFVLHYAHRYFGDPDRDGRTDQGIEFPGEPPRSYRDFIYVAVCVGATCQVSDFNITTCRFRNLVTLHGLFAFAFNTMILALGINIIAGLVGH